MRAANGREAIVICCKQSLSNRRSLRPAGASLTSLAAWGIRGAKLENQE